MPAVVSRQRTGKTNWATTTPHLQVFKIASFTLYCALNPTSTHCCSVLLLHCTRYHSILSTSQRCGPVRKNITMSSNNYDQASTNYKEAFSLFDKRGNGRVAIDSLGDLLRACGQNPTLAEIRDLEKNIGGDFDFETFQRVLNRPGGFREPGEPDEYCRGFQVFDKEMTGFIGVGQLKYILTNLGEKMTDEEVDELLKAVDTKNGQVNYTDLVRTILAN
ncbi:hypothetical protein QBC46DRAFT_390672 [Diplogelasinospora grovesii]|uniref:Calmodulin n=1 Tax=Diplogelasinospora grovesii TaxID=303347 RepID=A0AAN6N433_9PEZI|nr:hypothetical protein QBC46DRAFT_390672 [Diplogelasinospora grovesii]